MSHSTILPWSEELTEYDFGPQHPLSPIRVQLTHDLVWSFGLPQTENLQVLGDVPIADDETLLRVHTPELLTAVKQGGQDPNFMDLKHGLGTMDTPVFPNMHQAAARVCGATLTTVQSVYHGRSDHGVNFAGGLHHSMPDCSAGFCVYNDIAVAIQWLLDEGVERVAYIDVDVHHGDGVQAAFWDDPRVLTISIHESPRTLFPGTGWATEIGGPRALGTSVNIALPAGTGDQGWLRALHAVAPEVLAAFKPDFVVSQHGCDSHFEDPLASLAVSIDGQRMAAEAIHRWAHSYSGGNWVATGGGGYEWLNVVPRSWTHLVAEACGSPIAPDSPLPVEWREMAEAKMGRTPPETMTDGYDPWPKLWTLGQNRQDPVDAAVIDTRRAVFPYLGVSDEDDDL